MLSDWEAVLAGWVVGAGVCGGCGRSCATTASLVGGVGSDGAKRWFAAAGLARRALSERARELMAEKDKAGGTSSGIAGVAERDADADAVADAAAECTLAEAAACADEAPSSGAGCAMVVAVENQVGRKTHQSPVQGCGGCVNGRCQACCVAAMMVESK